GSRPDHSEWPPRRGPHGRDGRREQRRKPDMATPHAGAGTHHSASLGSGFVLNVGRLRAGALRVPGAYPKMPPATFPVERSGVFFIQVQEKEGKHVNRSCKGSVVPTSPAHLWRP